TDGFDSNPGTDDLPWLTFEYAFAHMSGGDTLYIKDGTYTQEIINPPAGTSNAYTIIKAVDNGRVLIDGSDMEEWHATLTIGGSESQYIIIEGLKFCANPNRPNIEPCQIVAGANHIKVFRCAFYNATADRNCAVLDIGPDVHDILIEECWTWGTGRYKVINYQSQRVIFRRCVSRHDYYNIYGEEVDNQTATFTMYDATDFLLQNCIAINSGNPDQTLTGTFYGGIWLENNDDRNTSGKIQGCILLDLDGLSAIRDPKIIGERIIENTVVWDSRGGYNAHSYFPSTNPTTLVNHCTFGNIFGSYGDESFAWGVGTEAELSIDAVTQNSIITSARSYGIADYMTSDWNLFF
ncbi:MAG: hypothetical protein P8Z50_07890, partial [candidate division WOR-3 bacterium]